ncbi:hypothetical protein FA10DRAFT_228591 [Acaromyces ingoldii]|uniref:GRIP domain-containing protein n=1 Tax=Acaromyces ingoldii TaxID=215250 RepID=A0A316YQA4_9BASI|nr:hypothetical protein FA10DRAFT_228591 [Acaromyces ingoldii]PWN91206.1 hypothetical protein FA10DRAFT_228591 [Acaromyces ingoldii]
MVINGHHEAAASASTSHKSSGSNSNEHKDASADEEPSSWPAEDDEEEKAGAQGQSVEALHAELERTREERDSFEGQYKGLLGKLTQMRSTLGDRLRQDAEELDRREQQIDSLTSRTEELEKTVEVLKTELVASHQDVDRATKELDALRATGGDASSSSSATAGSSSGPADEARRSTEVKTRELQEMAERYRIEAEGWESACMEERAHREELELELRRAREERQEAQRSEQEQRRLAESEAQSARGLQQVLEEFQAAQETELQRALGDHQERYERAAASLREHQERTVAAEAQATEFKGAAERCQALEKEVKEKNLLIGKLRHEAVILNEHLTEALRRLRANTSDSNVDRRLVTNLLLQFITTPRADGKRFEMLSLIASVLQWSDDERETAGLQRTNPGSSSSSSTMSPGKMVGIGIKTEGKGHGRSGALANASSTGDESFSNLFVEFLLSEAEQAKTPQSPSSEKTNGSNNKNNNNGASPSAPASPTITRPSGEKSRTSFNLGSLANLRRPSSVSQGNANLSPLKSPPPPETPPT